MEKSYDETIFLGDGLRLGVAAAITMLVAVGWTTAVRAAAPAAYLQDSTIVGAASTATFTRVPVVANGKTTYSDITINFAVSSTGALTIAPGYPIITASPTLETANFVPGSYVGAGGAKDNVINVTGPGATSGGATVWSFSAPACDGGSNFCNATWYVGPIAANPEYARLKAAKITSTAYSYGVADGNILIGVAQTGAGITVAQFTYNGDQPTPVADYSYYPSK